MSEYCQDGTHTWMGTICRNCAKPLPTIVDLLHSLAAADALYKAAKYALSEDQGDWKNPLADAMKDYKKMTGGKDGR